MFGLCLKSIIWYETLLGIKVGLESCRGSFDLGLARVWKKSCFLTPP